ncbi:hypothetical protein [Butyrivibrio sp. AE2032]|uniref:hypothetical protein n=1 Tax=Butyrivibrio sp. AE2032 TaxID=1458463 RepID=UPI001639E622|nr:hypothetical protein [Butyrivibrio sp. AE2032]
MDKVNVWTACDGGTNCNQCTVSDEVGLKSAFLNFRPAFSQKEVLKRELCNFERAVSKHNETAFIVSASVAVAVDCRILTCLFDRYRNRSDYLRFDTSTFER